jgi:hypothetical protein
LGMQSDIARGVRPLNIKYILEFSRYMNKERQIEILNMVMLHVEQNPLAAPIPGGGSQGLNIYLDELDDLTIQNIYNIIFRQMEILNSKYIIKEDPIQLKIRYDCH